VAHGEGSSLPVAGLCAFGGSLDIYIQHDPPPGHESNWLPAPSGSFSLSMRLYLPKASAIEGHYRYPTVRAV
jgi:hypothetical protein